MKPGERAVRFGWLSSLASLVAAALAYVGWVATVENDSVWAFVTAALFWLAVLVLLASAVAGVVRWRRRRRAHSS